MSYYFDTNFDTTVDQEHIPFWYKSEYCVSWLRAHQTSCYFLYFFLYLTYFFIWFVSLCFFLICWEHQTVMSVDRENIRPVVIFLFLSFFWFVSLYNLFLYVFFWFVEKIKILCQLIERTSDQLLSCFFLFISLYDEFLYMFFWFVESVKI